MIRIHFSKPEEGVQLVPLALAVLTRDGNDNLFRAPACKVMRQAGTQLWAASDPEAAQLFAYSINVDATPQALQFAEMARQRGLPCLFFDLSDREIPHRLPYGTIYRTSTRRSLRQPNEFGMVPLCVDALAQDDGALRDPAIRPWNDKPTVGFCGYLSPRWKQFLRMLRGERDKRIGHVVRSRALRGVARAGNAVQTRFVVRQEYFGGALPIRNDAARVQNIRDEYFQNMFDSDYVLCPRGAGNFSLRFFETLSAARIPVLIDTECVLPFEQRIDWQRHCVIVPESQIHKTGEWIAKFHRGLNEQTFIELQHANRRLWDEFVSPVAFHRQVVEDAVSSAQAS